MTVYPGEGVEAAGEGVPLTAAHSVGARKHLFTVPCGESRSAPSTPTRGSADSASRITTSSSEFAAPPEGP
jgi:hypothetical protein